MANYATYENQVLQLYLEIQNPEGKKELMPLPPQLAKSILAFTPDDLIQNSDSLRHVGIQVNETVGWIERRLMQQFMSERRSLIVKQFFVKETETGETKPVWVNSYSVRLDTISAPSFLSGTKDHTEMTIMGTIMEYEEAPYITPEPTQPQAAPAAPEAPTQAESAPAATDNDDHQGDGHPAA